MKILINPHPKLRKKSSKVKISDLKTPARQLFIEDLKKTMEEEDGIGLAAPQVGENIRIVAVATEDGPTIFINPIIIWKSFRKEVGEEGCLSIPEIFGLVKRHRTIRLTHYNQEGGKKILKVRGLLARVLQHEIDHLNGILFIDKMIKKITAE